MASQPTTQSRACVVAANGTGVIGEAEVNSVLVVCVTDRFGVGGTVSGLAGSGLVLRNNGGDDLVIAGNNGRFTFPATVPGGSGYEVTVAEQPSGPAQTRAVAGCSSTLAGSSVNTVSVSCGVRHWLVAAAVESGSGAISPPEQQVPAGAGGRRDWIRVDLRSGWFTYRTGRQCRWRRPTASPN